MLNVIYAANKPIMSVANKPIMQSVIMVNAILLNVVAP